MVIVAAMLRVPRSRGAFSGFLLVLLGAWGGLIPLLGPAFDYSFTPDRTWVYTEGRLLLEFLPAAGTVLGGLIVLGSANRAVASFGGWLAAASGTWFVVGRTLLAPWTSYTGGTPTGGNVRRAMEGIGFFSGLGVVIALLAGLALGRFAVVGVRETRDAQRAAEADTADTFPELRDDPDRGLDRTTTVPPQAAAPMPAAPPADRTAAMAPVTDRPVAEHSAAGEPEHRWGGDERLSDGRTENLPRGETRRSDPEMPPAPPV